MDRPLLQAVAWEAIKRVPAGSLAMYSMDLLLDPRVNQLYRPPPIGARQCFGSAEQPADQRPFVIHRAAVRPQMDAVEFIHRRILLGAGLAWQAGHFFRRGGHRTTAVMAARDALERGNLLAQRANFLTVAAHPNGYRTRNRRQILT